MARTLIALLLLSCTTSKITRVDFLDSTDPEEGSAHVCLVKGKRLDCITLDSFFKIMEREREKVRPTSDL